MCVKYGLIYYLYVCMKVSGNIQQNVKVVTSGKWTEEER